MSSEGPSAVFGDGAIALHRAARALDAMRDKRAAYGEGFFGRELCASLHDQLEQRGEEMDALTEQLSAKLGREHDAVVAFDGARDAVRDIVRALGPLRDPAAWTAPDVKLLAERVVEQVEGLRDGFDACRDRFMQAPRD